MSDMDYGEDLFPAWDFGDRVNAGRSLAVFLSQCGKKGQTSPGLWLVSNDLLRAGATLKPAESVQAVNDHSVSVVNYHVATVACFLSNIAGAPEDSPRQYAMVEANFDAAEMNNYLGGNLYFTGYASEDTTNDAFVEDKKGTLFARCLLRRALEPLDLKFSFGKDAAPQGCGLPFRRNEWDPVQLDAWCQSDGFRRPQDLPLELRTAAWVGVLYGQPEDHRSTARSTALRQALWEIFPAADITFCPFSHRFNNSEHLCIFVAGGFSRVVYMALVGYCEACLGADENFLPAMDEAFRHGSADDMETVLASLLEVEVYPRNRFGIEADEMARSASEYPDSTARIGTGDPRLKPRLMTRAEISLAFRYLHAAFQRPEKKRRGTTL